jgi:hypothetical protein
VSCSTERFQGKVTRINAIVAEEDFLTVAFERGWNCENGGRLTG